MWIYYEYDVPILQKLAIQIFCQTNFLPCMDQYLRGCILKDK